MGLRVSYSLKVTRYLSYGVFARSSKRPANVQQFTCILNTFAGSLLYVCWIV